MGYYCYNIRGYFSSLVFTGIVINLRVFFYFLLVFRVFYFGFERIERFKFFKFIIYI